MKIKENYLLQYKVSIVSSILCAVTSFILYILMSFMFMFNSLVNAVNNSHFLMFFSMIIMLGSYIIIFFSLLQGIKFFDLDSKITIKKYQLSMILFFVVALLSLIVYTNIDYAGLIGIACCYLGIYSIKKMHS